MQHKSLIWQACDAIQAQCKRCISKSVSDRLGAVSGKLEDIVLSEVFAWIIVVATMLQP